MQIVTEIMEYPNGKRDCALRFIPSEGNGIYTVLLDVGTCHTVGELLIQRAKELEQVIVTPDTSTSCRMCDGLVPDYDRVPVLRGKTWVHQTIADRRYAVMCPAQTRRALNGVAPHRGVKQ